MRPILTLLLAVLLSSCGKSPPPETSRSTAMSGLAATQEAQLAFTCAYEKDRIPPRDPEAEQLFQHARWLQKRNLLKEDPAQYPVFERLYRIAAAHGHDKAAHNLALLLIRGQSDASDALSLPVQLAQDLIRRGIPQGYYDMGVLLNKGYGVVGDPRKSLTYLRKTADLGSPEAQYYVGDRLFMLGIDYAVPFRIGLQMKKCAAEQGHTEAAMEYAVHLQDEGKLEAATKYFQMAVKAGSDLAANKLRRSFLAPPTEDSLAYLGLAKDEERSRRYKILSDILERYSYLNPTVDEIDQIVPLPPAQLPPWDGQIQWVKEWESGKAPPLPDAARIAEMAKAKGLDPATGRPLQAGS
ncbi:sel1 repeat family protein [Chitiniphilus purpureus]|uniref:Sel1 repeat family protein n=1 Tax=Chitiniphilus purpureus TaxID=2981137 RepID=A0ABY6DPT0_9NEIS|nr:sel1 repeat family protein [Chitiniphilus sp. CD1]UXY16342.1 sel1 repeat family protein [Chitiniphilus sp. CD1]